MAVVVSRNRLEISMTAPPFTSTPEPRMEFRQFPSSGPQHCDGLDIDLLLHRDVERHCCRITPGSHSCAVPKVPGSIQRLATRTRHLYIRRNSYRDMTGKGLGDLPTADDPTFGPMAFPVADPLKTPRGHGEVSVGGWRSNSGVRRVMR